MFGYYVQQPSLWHDVNRTLHRPINYCIYLWRRLRVTSRERGRSWMYEPRRSKIGSSKEIVGECKYMIIPGYLYFCPFFLNTAETPAYLCIIRWWRTWGYRIFTALLGKMLFFFMENRIQTCFHDQTSCKIHRGCVLMDKYAQVVIGAKLLYKNMILSVSVEKFIVHSHKTLRWISILVATFNFYMLCLQSNRSYFIPVLYVYINKRKKHVWTVFP